MFNYHKRIYALISIRYTQTVDLYEGTNLAQVISGLHALGRVCKKKGLAGIGPKESEANVRNFSNEQLEAGKNIIGLQV